MFLKIRFSPTCFSSGNQVISWAVAENNSVIVEFLLPSSFGGHHSKAFLRQIGKKILLLSSQLLIQTWSLVCTKVIALYICIWDVKKAEFMSLG